MKILTINTDSNAGGSTQSLLLSLEGLKNTGHEILAITARQGYFTDALDALGIAHVEESFLSINVWPKLSNLKNIVLVLPRFLFQRLKQIVSYYRLTKIIKQNRPDLIHTNNSLTTVGYRLSKKFHIPHLWHIREYGQKDFGFHRFPTEAVFKHRLKQSKFVTITKALASYYGDSDCRHVIYNGIGVNSSSEIKPENKNKWFLYVGSISKEKGFSDLLYAFAEYKSKNKGTGYKLIVLGSPISDYMRPLNKLIKELDLHNNVIFKGQVENVSYYMQKSRATIVPSIYEAFGRITAEAMLNKCLVIGRNTAGTKEQFDNGVEIFKREIGLRFNSVLELVDRLYEAENMSLEHYYDITNKAYKTAMELYSVSQHQKALINFIESFNE